MIGNNEDHIFELIRMFSRDSNDQQLADELLRKDAK